MKHHRPQNTLSSSSSYYHQRTPKDILLPDPSYCYLQYIGNVPYYSDFPKLKFIRKDEWRFSSDLYQRYCNLNSPLNRCYISSTPRPQYFDKRHHPENEKLDYYYNRGYKKILNQELQKDFEKFGYDSKRDIHMQEFDERTIDYMTERERNYSKYDDKFEKYVSINKYDEQEEEQQYENFPTEREMMINERKMMRKEMIDRGKTERKLKYLTDKFEIEKKTLRRKLF